MCVLSGKEARRAMRLAGKLTIIVCLVFLFAPMAMIVVFSFFENSYLVFPPSGWTTKWYAWAIDRREFLDGLRTSFLLGVAATTISTLLAVPAALALGRSQVRGRGIIEGALISPLLIPTIILGIALLIYASAIGLRLGFHTLLLGHVVITTPFVMRNVIVSVAGLPRHVEEAAVGLGAIPFRAFRRVVLPLISPGVIAGAILAFLISFDELAMTIFLTSPNVVTLPVRIFNYVEWHLDPGVAALSTILISFTAVLLIILERLRRSGGLM